MPAVTWPTGGNASPDIDASIHKVLSPICKPVHLAALDLTSRVKKKKEAMYAQFYSPGPVMEISDHSL